MNKAVTFLLAAMITWSAGAQETEGQGFFKRLKGGIDPATIAGLYQYDENDVYRALKIRRNKSKNEIAAILEEYNRNIEGLRMENFDLLVGLGEDISDIVKEKNWKEILNARSDFKKHVGKVRNKARSFENDLQLELMESLKKRQVKRWIRYADSIRYGRENSVNTGNILSYVGF